MWHAIKIITNIDYMYMYPSSQHKNSSNTMEKIRSNTTNSWENLTQYYLLTCRIIVNLIVWEIGRGKEAAGQSRAPRRVMWMKCLPRDTFQPMEAALRNSNEIICKHRKLRLQVPGKVFRVSGRRLLHGRAKIQKKSERESSFTIVCSLTTVTHWFWQPMRMAMF